MKTIAIIVGISDYKDPAFESLPGAKADAGRFASALASWGLPNEWIHLIPQDKTTKAYVIKTFLDCRSEFDADAKLIFYFAGHGIRENDKHRGMRESAMVLHDTSSANSLSTGLSLTELMQLIQILDPLQTFLFFDACSLRLNQINNPLNDTEVLSLNYSKGLFCLFSSGINPSFEDTIYRYGYFTNALLKAMSDLRLDARASCFDLIKKVQETLQEQSLPLSESYSINSDKLWPLDQHYENDNTHTNKDLNCFVLRKEALAKLQDCIVGTTNPIIWMWGEGGLGKTVIAEQLIKKNGSALYASIPSIPGAFSWILQTLIEQVRLQRGELFFDRPPDSSFQQTLSHLVCHNPESILVLDHLDRLATEDLSAILKEIDNTWMTCILISRYPCPKRFFKQRAFKIIEWCATPLNFDEAKQIMVKNGADLSVIPMLLNATEGNALKVCQMVAKLSGQDVFAKEGLEAEYVKAVTAIVGCGGFLDQHLFAKIFKIESNVLTNLEKLGLIRYTKEGCYPHDILIEMVQENQWPISISDACRYWNLQMSYTPYNRWACRSLIFLSSQLDDCRPFKQSLGACLHTLNKREYLSSLIDLVTIFQKHHWEYLLLKSTDYLIEQEEYCLSGKILKHLMHSKNFFVKIHSLKNESRRLVLIGQYFEGLKLCDQLLTKRHLHSVLVFVRNNMGVAYYFLGEWDKAAQLFQKNLDIQGEIDKRELGFAYFMMGVIMSYRHENPIKTKKLLENSLRIFESLHLYSWVIGALNQIAHFAYGLKQSSQALCYLEKALELAKALQNKTFCIYTLAYIGRVYLRYFDPFNPRITSILCEIEQFHKQVKDLGPNWITPWALFTMCSIYTHRKEVQKLESMSEEFMLITKKHNQIHIYALFSSGHLAYLKDDYAQAKCYYQQAYTLAKLVNNQFAIRDIQEDFKKLSFPFTLKDFATPEPEPMLR